MFPMHRSQPVNSFEWGTDTVISVRFNPGEPNILATSARYIRILMNIMKCEHINSNSSRRVPPIYRAHYKVSPSMIAFGYIS